MPSVIWRATPLSQHSRLSRRVHPARDAAAWIDASGQRLHLLKDPMDVDLIKSDHVNLSDSLAYAKEVDFVPVAFEITTRRYYEVKAEGMLEVETGVVRAHTQKGQNTLSISGVENLSLAVSSENNPSTSQCCHFPASEAINAKLSSAGLGVQQKDFITYTLPLNADWLEASPDILLEMTCLGVEFGDSMIGAPYFIVPHIPYIDLVQAAQ